MSYEIKDSGFTVSKGHKHMSDAKYATEEYLREVDHSGTIQIINEETGEVASTLIRYHIIIDWKDDEL